jgi:purine-binding chemotaxis protein CheW
MTPNDRRFLQFTLGTDYYAVDILAVKEVLTTPTMTPIPNSPDYVCGVFNLRGTVLMVIDLRTKFHIKAPEKEDFSGTIIFDLGEILLGAKVDHIQQVLNISGENIKPPPHLDQKNGEYIQGVIQHENQLIMWLDPHQLIKQVQKYQQAA